MSAPYKLGQRRGQCELVYYDKQGKRHRHALGTSDADEAERLAPAIYAEATRPKGRTVEELWEAYDRAKSDRAILKRRPWSWKALAPRFGRMDADAISRDDCIAHIAARRASGVKDGTIHTELGHLRTTLTWAEKQGYIKRAPWIERPPQPKPREEHLTKDQARALIDAAQRPHVKLYLILALGTAARNAALLGLTWERCDFTRGLIDLRDPTLTAPHKGRAITPMNAMVKKALTEAHASAQSVRYVIEYGGKPIKSMKKSLKSAAAKIGLAGLHPHMLRHTAAVFMAEGGVPMEEISQYLGHTSVEVTRRIYARYSPEYLRKAAGALEL